MFARSSLSIDFGYKYGSCMCRVDLVPPVRSRRACWVWLQYILFCSSLSLSLSLSLYIYIYIETHTLPLSAVKFNSSPHPPPRRRIQFASMLHHVSLSVPLLFHRCFLLLQCQLLSVLYFNTGSYSFSTRAGGGDPTKQRHGLIQLLWRWCNLGRVAGARRAQRALEPTWHG